MENIYIHIGTHKTGTTSIQKFLKINKQILLENDFYVPETGAISDFSGHHNLAWELSNDKRYDSKRGGLKDLIRELEFVKQKNAIISSEDFGYAIKNPLKFKEFEEKIRKKSWRTYYIIFFRNQDQYAISLYRLLINNGMKGSYFKFINYILKNKYYMYNGWYFEFDYYGFYKKLKNNINGEIIVKKFIKYKKNQNNLTQFIECLGLNVEIFNKNTINIRENQSNEGFSRFGKSLLPVVNFILHLRFFVSNIKLETVIFLKIFKTMKLLRCFFL